jgi:ATP-dependent helicase HepA
VYSIGQRFVSEPEPELGLGIVVELSHKRVTVAFSETERTYSTEEPPIKRVQFRPGDNVVLRDGTSHRVEAVREEKSTLYYLCASGEFSEALLSESVTFTAPTGRFFRGIYDRTEDFDRRLNALRMRSSFEMSPVRGFCGGKIELFPHQLSVAHSVVSAEKRRFFLADEVGLGKTVEAALIIHRLLLTGEVSRVLIVVPSALIHQWFVELYRRFSILTTIVNDEFKKRFSNTEENLFEYESPVIITLEDLARGDSLSQAALQASWDLTVVDEAHHLQEDSNEYRTIRELAQHSPDLLLLTASPEALDERSLFALLQLLDPVKYASIDRFNEERAQYVRVASLAEKVLNAIPISPGEQEFLTGELQLSTSEQIELIPEEQRDNFARQLIDICGIGRVIFRNSRRVISGFPKRKVTFHSCNSSESDPILTWIDQFITEQSEKKVLIICSNMKRMNELNRLLSRRKNRKTALFHEEMSLVQLDRSAAWFADPAGASTLIATEIGSEGRNFQYAHHLLMADIPENPELLEQRIGRLDRIGRTTPVSIVIPTVEKSYQERLTDWYHRGVNAFRRTVPGAFQIGEQFLQRVKTFSGSSAQWEQLIAETVEFSRELEERIERGRNRLLELSSFNRELSELLKSQIESQESEEMIHSCEQLFAHFGIAVTPLGNSINYLDFDTLSDHSFPVPLLCDEGMSVTFHRNVALAREDIAFLSMDHPMVIGAMDLILGSSCGNSTISHLPHAGESGFLLELIYLIATPGGSSHFPEQFLPQLVVRKLYDDEGDEVSELFDEQYLQKKCNDGSLSLLHQKEEQLISGIETILRESETSLEQQCDESISEAMKRMNDYYENEITRARVLANSDKLATLTEKREALRKLIAKSTVRLDAVRLIVLTE